MHVFGCLLLREVLILLLCDPFEELHAVCVLHDEINVPTVVVRLVVLGDIWVVQGAQRRNLDSEQVKLLVDFKGGLAILSAVILIHLRPCSGFYLGKRHGLAFLRAQRL